MSALDEHDEAAAVATALLALTVKHHPNTEGVNDEEGVRQLELSAAFEGLIVGLEEGDDEYVESVLETLRENAEALDVAHGVAAAYEERAAAIRHGHERAQRAATARLIDSAPSALQTQVNAWCRGQEIESEVPFVEQVRSVCTHGPDANGALDRRWLGPDKDVEGTVTVVAMASDDTPRGLAGALVAAFHIEPSLDWPLVAAELCAERLEWSPLSPVGVRHQLVRFMRYDPESWLERLTNGGRLLWDRTGPCGVVSEPLDERRFFADGGGDKWITEWTIFALEESWLVMFERMPL